MGNWTDRFDPETVDEIKRYEVGEGDFLLAERLDPYLAFMLIA